MDASDSTNAATAPSGSSRRSFSLWVLGLALVLCVLFHESLLGGRGLVPADGVLSFPPWTDLKGPANILLVDQFLVFLPQHEFMHQQFLAGHFPLWNPYLACGIPTLASAQGALLFPINLLLLPLSPFYAGGVAAFLKLFLAGWFTMLYLRVLGVSNSGAFLSGLVFCLSGFMIVWLGHPHVNCALCLPLLFYLVERFFQCVRQRTSCVRGCIGLALAFGCLLLGGHPPTMIHVALVAGIYFIFRWRGQREKPLWQPVFMLGAFVAGFLLAAPAILPFLEYDAHSSEAVSSAGLHRAGMHLSLNELIFYLVPHASGSPADGWEDTLLRLGVGRMLGNYNEHTGYVGVLPWLFALYAVGQRRRNPVIWFHALAIPVCFLFILGVPPFPALLDILPVVRVVNPMRLMLVAGFSVAVLAGFGWDRFQRREPGRLEAGIMAGFWVVMGTIIAGYVLAVAPRWSRLPPDYRAYLWPQLELLAGSALVSGALLLRTIHQRPGLRTALALGWVGVDMLAFAWNYNPQISRDRYYPSTPAIAWLQQHSGSGRVLGDQMVLAPNVAQVFGLRDARGYDFTTVRRYEELINGQAGDFFFYRSSLEPPKAMPLLGVKYWLSFRKPNPDPSQYELVYSNEISIFRYRPVCARALVVYDYRVESNSAPVLQQVRSGTFDPRRTVLLETPPEGVMVPTSPSAGLTDTPAQIVTDEADCVRVETRLPQPGFLLLLDTYFPGWTATVNGEPAKIYRADYNFRAVRLPAGPSTVGFVYRPLSFRLGLLLAAIGWLILGAAFLVSRRKLPPAERQN